MSPVAAALAAGLHVATALALFLVSPLNRPDIDDGTGKAIEVTIEQPKPPEPPPPVQEAVKPQPPPQPTPPPQQAAQPAPPPPPPTAAAQKPQPKPPAQVSKEPLGVAPPPPEKKTEEAKLEPKPEPPPEPKPEPKQEAAVAPPSDATPPPETPLEKVLPPVEQPTAPLSMRDFVKVLPPPPAPPPSPPAPHPTAPPQHAAPQPPAQTLQHSPLSTAQPQAQASASAAPSSTFVNPADADRQLRAKDAYLWQVIRKFSQYLPDLREKNEGGTVLLRFVIARDGRLIEASIAKSSGVPALDRGLLESLRAAAPYPPLPPEIPGAQVVFVQPIGAARR